MDKNIQALRSLLGMTQEEFAKVLDVSRSAVTQWENGWTQPRMGVIQTMAGMFGVPVSWIIEDNGMAGTTLGTDGKIVKRELNGELAEGIAILRGLSSSALTRALGYLQCLADQDAANA